MSIIYSYPEQGATVNPNDMLIGTSATKVGGKQKNLTKNFTVQQIADFINDGVGLIDPVATDFKIPVFNQGGLKITGSIMSQNAFPNGTGITVSGNLTATGNLLVSGNTTLGGVPGTTISLLGQTTFTGAVRDVNQSLGSNNQVLLSNGNSQVVWTNYTAGLTYQGTWDALNNTTNGLANSPALASNIGTNGHFYIVNIAGSTNLNGITDWKVGDWAVFVESGAIDTWQKIDNSSALIGSGTDNKIAMWTGGATPSTTLTDSLISQAGTVVSVDGSLNTNGSIGTGVANYDITTQQNNQNLRVKGNGIGGLEVRGDSASLTDAKITLNCYQNTHGVTIKSPPHFANATYTLVLPTTVGTLNQVLSSGGASPSQLQWTSLPSNIVSGYGTTNTIPIYTDGTNGIIGNSIMSYAGTVISVNGDFSTQGLEVNKYLTDGAGSNGADGFVLTSTTSGTDREILWVDPTTIGDSYDLGSGVSGAANSIELKLTSGSGTDNSAITLTGGTGITVAQTGDIVTLTGSAQGVTSVTGTANRIAITGTASVPIVNAVTGTVNSSSLTLATGQEIQNAIDLALSGTLTFKGTFNASNGTISSGTNSGLQLYTGTAGGVAIAQGDFYIADTAGSFYNTTAMNVGDEAIALVSRAAIGSSVTDWSVVPSAGAGVTDITNTMGTFVTGTTNTAQTGSVSLGTLDLKNNGTGSPTTPDATKFYRGDASWQTVAGYSPWNLSGQGGTAEAVGSGETVIVTSANTAITTAVASPRTLTLTSTPFGGNAIVGHVPDASGAGDNTKFLKGDGTWAEAAAAGGSQIDVYTTPSIGTPNGTKQTFGTLGSTNIDNISQTEVYIDGVYQSTSTYNVSNVSGTTQAGTYITFLSAPPTGVDIEIRVVENIIYTNIVTQSFTIPTYVAGNLTAVPFGLYIFTQAFTRDLALPINPVNGTSFKVSSRYAAGATTPINRIVRNTTNTTAKIMGLDADLNLDTLPASFEVIWTGSAVANTTFQGWVIVGAGS
jgi:hypothetical protein